MAGLGRSSLRLRYRRRVQPSLPTTSVQLPTARSGRGTGAESIAGVKDGRSATAKFEVHLDNFEGPFDLLLGLIAKHKLDVTEVALSQVTVEFIEYIRRAGADWDLGVATEFLVVASTLLDLKAARLLPAADVEDDEDLALLETRDLLFARLLQYRAYKEAGAHLGLLVRTQALRRSRQVTLESRFSAILPELLRGFGVDRFAELAAQAMRPRASLRVVEDHLHIPRVSVPEHVAELRTRLSVQGAASFRSLVADCSSTLEVVARFLALLELHREGAVAFDQVVALGELRVRWISACSGGGQAGATGNGS